MDVGSVHFLAIYATYTKDESTNKTHLRYIEIRAAANMASNVEDLVPRSSVHRCIMQLTSQQESKYPAKVPEDELLVVDSCTFPTLDQSKHPLDTVSKYFVFPVCKGTHRGLIDSDKKAKEILVCISDSLGSWKTDSSLTRALRKGFRDAKLQVHLENIAVLKAGGYQFVRYLCGRDGQVFRKRCIRVSESVSSNFEHQALGDDSPRCSSHAATTRSCADGQGRSR